MEYIVDGFEVEWEAKAPSMGRHDLGDREGAQSFVVEFFRGSLKGGEIACVRLLRG